MQNSLDILALLLLGIIQGIAEWLPISSEGLNTLVMITLLGVAPFEAVRVSLLLHFGTLLAAVVYFRDDVTRLLRVAPRILKQDEGNPVSDVATLRFLLVSTLVSMLVAYPLFVASAQFLEVWAAYATATVGALLIFTGIVLRTATQGTTRAPPSVLDSLLLGVVQGFTVLPGLSRSGLTTSALLWRGNDSASALRLSFLMSIPAVLVSSVYLLVTSPSLSLSPVSAAGIFAAFLVGLVSIHVLMRFAARINFGWFCIFLGAISQLSLLGFLWS
jgi:undecaprenyl-diphosphatase